MAEVDVENEGVEKGCLIYRLLRTVSKMHVLAAVFREIAARPIDGDA